MRYVCRFLTSFGKFSASYPSSGRLPHQRLLDRDLVLSRIDVNKARTARRSFEGGWMVHWTDHKHRFAHQRWPPDASHMVKRRGHIVTAKIQYAPPFNEAASMTIVTKLEYLSPK